MAQGSGGKPGNQPSTATTPSTARAGSITPEVTDDPATARAANPPVPTTRGTVGAVATPAPDRPKPYLSEGMRNDLEAIGWAVDPVSGARYEVNRETGDVYVTERGATPPAPVAAPAPDGPVHKVDVKVNPPATFVDPKTGVETVNDPETGETRVTQPGSGVTTVTDKDGESRTIDDPRT